MIWYLCAIGGILLIGLVVVFRDLFRQIDNREYAEMYRDKLHSYMTDIENNYADYEWLQRNSVRMQQRAGMLGIVSHFRPPFENFAYKNFQMFVNLVPQIRTTYLQWQQSGLSSFLHNTKEYALTLDDALLRYIGQQDSFISEAQKKVKNPFMWLREGVRWIVTFPITFFYWTGIIRYTWYAKLTNNFFIRFLSSAITLIGLISSIITIVTGYNPFVEIIRKSVN